MNKWDSLYRAAIGPAEPRGRVIPAVEDKEIRCPECNHLLAKGELAPGSRIQFKCSKGCRRTVTFAVL